MSANPLVYVVDDEPGVRAGLASVLVTHGFEVSTFSTAEAFLASLATRESGCVVSDVRMPGIGGVDLLRELGGRRPDLPVVLITGHGDIPMAVSAIKAGAYDFLEKPIDDMALVGSIRAALAATRDRRNSRRDVGELRARFEKLSPREREVLRLVVAGSTNAGIASLLSISQRTVEHHRAHVMQKLDAASLSDLVKIAIALGDAG